MALSGDNRLILKNYVEGNGNVAVVNVVFNADQCRSVDVV